MHIKTLLLIATAWAGIAYGQSTNSEATLRGSLSSDVYGAATYNLTGSRAIVQVGSQTADSGAQSVLGVVGARFQYMATNIVGVYFDTSYVDGGSAYAYVGNYRQDVKGNIFDYQGGFVLQYPGKTWRPYINVGGGGAQLSADFTTTVGSSVSTNSSRTSLSEIVYGGGVRRKFSDHWGARIAFEGVNLSGANGGSRQNYGRFVSGVFWESK